jgi:hypothetical protein
VGYELQINVVKGARAEAGRGPGRAIQNGGPMCYIAAVAMERGPARGIEGDGFQLTLLLISITAEVRL